MKGLCSRWLAPCLPSELLGRASKDRAPKGPPGKLRLAFEKAHQLPRNQQNRIVEFVEAYVNQYASKAS
jgi:hypothetical protein